MTSLPSFVQLMASLGLENTPTSQQPQQQAYCSSPSIVVSEHDLESEIRVAKYRVARYAPYSAPISHARRASSSSLSTDGTELERPDRSSSASPRLRINRHKPVALKLGHESRHRHTASESQANMPISSYVRRKTPQSSPISPTFPISRPNRRRSQSPIMPVSIPTLPPVFFSTSRSSTPEDAEDGDRSASPCSDEEKHFENHLTANYLSEKRRNSEPFVQRSIPLSRQFVFA